MSGKYILVLFILLFQNACFDFGFSTPQQRDSLVGGQKSGVPDTFIVNKIILSGNKITKPQIIFRELLFHENDTIAADRLSWMIEQSQKNLLNTSLFNFANIDTVIVSGGNRINITIMLVERWYIWPSPFFQLADRNFNVWWETKDLSKADYGLYLNWENFRGRKENLSFLVRLGYDESFGISYKIPYINKKKTIGAGFIISISGNHEVPFKNFENKQLYYKDRENYVQQTVFGTFSINYRKNIFNTHTFQINYNDYSFADSLLILNPRFSTQKHLQFLTFYYMLKSDHRDIKAYPLNGYYFDLELVKYGLGILENENIAMAFLHTSIRKFWNIHKRWYFSGGVNAKLSTSAFQPYFMERGLGYGNDYVRSYEYYVVGGQSFALLKTNLKFELVPTKVKKLKFIPAKKFNMLYYSIYLNLLGDAAYVFDKHALADNKLSNTALMGTGLGIDFVTYYDKVFRLEYSINKKGESGFFIHFVSPI